MKKIEHKAIKLPIRRITRDSKNGKLKEAETIALGLGSQFVVPERAPDRSAEHERVAIILRNSYHQHLCLRHNMWHPSNPNDMPHWDNGLPGRDGKHWRLLARAVVKEHVDPFGFIGVISEMSDPSKVLRPGDFSMPIYRKLFPLWLDGKRIRVENAILAIERAIENRLHAIPEPRDPRVVRAIWVEVFMDERIDSLCRWTIAGTCAKNECEGLDESRRDFLAVQNDHDLLMTATAAYFKNPTTWDELLHLFMTADMRSYMMHVYCVVFDVPDDFVIDPQNEAAIRRLNARAKAM